MSATLLAGLLALLPAAAATRVALPGHEVPLLGSAQRIGPADPGDSLSLSIALTPPNPSARDSFLEDLYDPSSPSYQQFLTPDQYAQRFGPTPEQVQQVVDFLEGEGIPVSAVSPNRLRINAATTVAGAEQVFGVHIDRYLLADGRTVWANDSAPKVPAALTGLITAVRGLDSTLHYHPMKPRPMPRADIGAPGSPGYGFAPTDLANAYDLAPFHSAGMDGQGQTLAIYELDGYPPSDVAAYFAFYSITPPAITNILVGGATGGAGMYAVEVDLDIEVAGGIAPAADLLVYEGTDFDGTYNQIVTDDKAHVVSISWGECESDFGTAPIQALDDIFAQGAAEGMAFFAASGDEGAYGCNDFGNDATATTLAVASPSDDPWVTGIGGTTLTMNGNSYGSESAWGSTIEGGLGGGGGLSTVFPLPSWQKGPGVQNQYSNGMRQVPDLSANADPASCDAMYCTVVASSAYGCGPSGWIEGDGTSAAAPTWAATMTLVNQYLVSKGKSHVGSVNPTFYRQFQLKGEAGFFHDVTSGTNLYYPATADYDLASGMGSPQGVRLAEALTQGTVAAASTGSKGLLHGCEVGGGPGQGQGAASLAELAGGLMLVTLVLRRRGVPASG